MDALYVEGLTKSFGGAKALDDVTFSVVAGEIHGLVGRNGSGKSTLIKILSGYHSPDSWRRCVVAGKEVQLPLSPGQPTTLGLTFVHQDLGLIPSLSVLENLRVARYQASLLGRIHWKDERRKVSALLEEFEIQASPNQPISSLPPIERALIAIVRALADTINHQGGALVLDEPTSFLPMDGVERLFGGMRRVADAGFGVVFVSHRLEEVLTITDRVSVLRDGHMVGTAETSEINEPDLIEMILGRRMEESYVSPTSTVGKTKLRVTDLEGAHLHQLSFDAHEGEILGLTGLAGMGQDEVVYLLFGAIQANGGSIVLDGETHQLQTLSPALAMSHGMALLPADRLVASGVGSLSLSSNISLPVLGRFFKSGRLRKDEESKHVQGLLDALDVRPPNPQMLLNLLSGGNQQKALLGKWFQRDPKVLLLDEPSQGVDIGARRDIFKRIREMATGGSTIILSSTDYDDLAHVCDRVLVFRYGKIVAEAKEDSLTEQRLIEFCYSSATSNI